MKFEMNLIENSYDYLMNALDLYKVADEAGTHLAMHSNIKKKSKWKLAFVSLVQSFELLLKYLLFQTNRTLIYENIDEPKIDKTVSIGQAIKRIENLKILIMPEENKKFIRNCANLRNEFIHGTVVVKTEEIKTKFCKLVSLYGETHNKAVQVDLTNKLYDEYTTLIKEVILFASEMTIFRGCEMTKEVKKDFEIDIKNNPNYCFRDRDGNIIEKIKFGDENKVLRINGLREYESSVYDFEYCDDCLAKQGEYHYPDCDLEICPICFQQALTCDCGLEFCENKDE